MTDSERIDACMKQADFAFKLFDGRRTYEWKVTLGLWAMILASIAVLKGQPLPIWVGPVIVIVYASFWVRGTWVANENDKQMAIHFRTHAEKILLNPKHEVTPSPGKIQGVRWLFGFLFDWSRIFQLVTTIILVMLAYKFIQ